MSDIPRKLSRLVRDRALNHCDYCGLSQEGQEATFHIDHIIPQSKDGQTKPENLALACVTCSLRKGSKIHSQDAQSKEIVPLFHPRKQNWREHFRFDAEQIVGITPTGRASVAALQLNRPRMIAIRYFEKGLGRFPPAAGWGTKRKKSRRG